MDQLPIDEEKRIKHFLLRPIIRHKYVAADRRAIIKALERLDARAIGQESLKETVEIVRAGKRDQDGGSWKDPVIAGRRALLAQTLRASRRISYPEYVFFASAPVEGYTTANGLTG